VEAYGQEGCCAWLCLGNRGHGGEEERFNVLAFWADPAIRTTFPVRERVFESVFAAVNHEATCESMFSVAGQLYSNSRSDMSVKQLCEAVMCASGEKRCPTSAAEVQRAYKKMKRDRAAAEGASSSSST
jgi:hypothetical protein